MSNAEEISDDNLNENTENITQTLSTAEKQKHKKSTTENERLYNDSNKLPMDIPESGRLPSEDGKPSNDIADKNDITQTEATHTSNNYDMNEENTFINDGLMTISPYAFLSSQLSHRIRVVLKWSITYIGNLIEFDSYFNLVLGEVKEYVDGALQEGTIDKMVIRCNNIKYIEEL